MHSGDPFELGSARPLDLAMGAHRLELMSNFTLAPGQAVSIGLALDSTSHAQEDDRARRGDASSRAVGLRCPCGRPCRAAGRAREPDVLAGLEQFRGALAASLHHAAKPLAPRSSARISLPLMKKASAACGRFKSVQIANMKGPHDSRTGACISKK
jgi:hypothetical protein